MTTPAAKTTSHSEDASVTGVTGGAGGAPGVAGGGSSGPTAVADPDISWLRGWLSSEEERQATLPKHLQEGGVRIHVMLLDILLLFFFWLFLVVFLSGGRLAFKAFE